MKILNQKDLLLQEILMKTLNKIQRHNKTTSMQPMMINLLKPQNKTTSIQPMMINSLKPSQMKVRIIYCQQMIHHYTHLPMIFGKYWIHSSMYGMRTIKMRISIQV